MGSRKFINGVYQGTGNPPTDWVFVGACRCPVNNGRHAICEQHECPLHGSDVAPLHGSDYDDNDDPGPFPITDPWEV